MTSVLLLVFFLSLATSSAQITPAQEMQARQELQRRNINEQELKSRLLSRGIDVENMNPAELAAVQSEVEQVIAEMEAEGGQLPVQETPARADQEEEAQPATPPVPTPELSTPPENLPDSDIWGHQIFRNKSLQVYQTNDNVSAPPSYRLGTGDVIAINIFGASQEDLKLTIDSEGFINPAGMPRIQLRGLRLEEARELARNRFGRFYIFKTGQFSFNVDSARTITVNIYGETEANGSFTLSAVNTVFNALVAAGGPKDIGSVRNIKLISGGKETVIDLYEFLLNPKQQSDLFLENNDVIFVPLAEEIVEIQGAVKRPLRYELKADEGLDALLAYAGGLTPNALPEGITITRTVGNNQSVINADYLAGQGNSILLSADDVVRVPVSIYTQLNQVSISGAVSIPGVYAYTPGMRVKDLLSRGKLLPGSRTDAGFLRRRNVDSTSTLIPLDYAAVLNNDPTANITLQSEDQLIVFSKSTYIPRYTISVNGAVNETLTRYPYSEDGVLSVRDAILLAGGLKANANNEAFLIRSNPSNNLEKQYVLLNLDASESMDKKLRPLDSLVIYTNERFSESFPVTISGAVRLPGNYVYDPSLSLSDLFVLAGGLKLEAARNRIDVIRLQYGQNETTKTISTSLEIDDAFNVIGGPTNGFRLRPYDVVVVRSVPEFELVQTVNVAGEVRFPGDYALDADNLKLTDLLERAGGVTAEAFPPGATMVRTENGTGSVVIQLDEAIKSPNSVANIKLRDGDIISIPKARELVGIRPIGTRADQVYADSLLSDGSLDVAFSGNRSAKWYIDNYAGGFQDRARRKSLTIQYPNGELGRTKKVLWFNVYPKVRPGSAIQLDMKDPRPERKAREEPIDWGSITQAALGGITTFVTLYLLIDRTGN